MRYRMGLKELARDELTRPVPYGQQTRVDEQARAHDQAKQARAERQQAASSSAAAPAEERGRERTKKERGRSQSQPRDRSARRVPTSAV